MEENKEPSLFEMDLDSTGQAKILSISKWSRFIAISLFTFIALMILAMVLVRSQVADAMAQRFGWGESESKLMIVVILILLGFIGAWMFVLLRAANQLKNGVINKDSKELASGFRSLKVFFVFGIIYFILTLLGNLASFF